MNTDPTILIVFGATGDLMAKKIIPAIYTLFKEHRLPDHFKVIGSARRDFSGEKFNELIAEKLKKYLKVENAPQAFFDLFIYHQGQLDDEATYQSLKSKLVEIDHSFGEETNKLFYYSISPDFYKVVTSNIAQMNLNKAKIRLIIEKPFGEDSQTAIELDHDIKKSFSEEQIFRIDHYLGKKILQDLLNLRIEKKLDTSNVKKISISTIEDFGAEDRGAFYEKYGALRDVGQNHLLEIFALVTMNLDGDNVRESCAEAIKQLKILSESDVKQNTIRAQYEGYREIKDVAQDSQTETYFKIKAFTESGIEVIIEAGKKLAETKSQIILEFDDYQILIDFKPNQSILKTYSDGRQEILVSLADSHAQYVEEYAELLDEAIKGRQDNFISIDEVLAEWNFVDPIELAWKNNLIPLKFYEPNTNNY
jgi:glucose-6-phosphate 1-dehydrogenase